jgi:hypothetical protein
MAHAPPAFMELALPAFEAAAFAVASTGVASDIQSPALMRGKCADSRLAFANYTVVALPAHPVVSGKLAASIAVTSSSVAAEFHL